jgi:hypothetical protein
MRTWDQKTGKHMWVEPLTEYEEAEREEEAWQMGTKPAFADLPPNSDLTNVVPFPVYLRWLRTTTKMTADDFRQLN